MSLHLIESRKVPARSSRKRFGATASVIVHAVLVVGAFTAASAAPVLQDKPHVDDIVYVAPDPTPIKAANTASSKSSNNCSCTEATPMPIVNLTHIPIDIPAINPEADLMHDLVLRSDFARKSNGTGNGTETGIGLGGGGTLAPDAVMTDLQVDRQVSILSGYRTPRYPEMLRAAGVEETLNATFVVDTLGRVEAGSLEIPTAQHAQFVAAVREALSSARFRPAEVHGRPVRQRVMQAFVFSLQRN